MEKSIVRVNTQALSAFSKALDLANKAQEEQSFHEAEWFDTLEKRLQWWYDLEPQWRQAFNEAVFSRKSLKSRKTYIPNDRELSYLLFEVDSLYITGFGEFENRNNNPKITFQLTNLSGVTNLTNLKRIECDYNGQIESLEPLKNLKKLTCLWCDNNRISDLSPLMTLTSLTDLCCWNNQINNIEPLASLLQMRSLSLGLYNQGNPIDDPSPIKHLKSLRYLYMTSCNLTNIDFLRECPELQYIDIDNNNFEPIEELEHLRKWRWTWEDD